MTRARKIIGIALGALCACGVVVWLLAGVALSPPAYNTAEEQLSAPSPSSNARTQERLFAPDTTASQANTPASSASESQAEEPGQLTQPALPAPPARNQVVAAVAGVANTSYEHTATLETWHTVSEATCAEYAQNTLKKLRATGVELVEAGYLDLAGECWACVVRTEAGEAYSITLLPQRPFGLRSDTNQLAVSILHYLMPEGLEFSYEEE